MIKPFPHSYWVVRGQLLAGCYPGDTDPAKAEAMAAGLVGAGIRQVINLMEENELDKKGNPFRPYWPLVAKQAEAAGTQVGFTRFPIPDLDVPSRAQMNKILASIDAGIAAGRPVYLHCYGGTGRTGTVVCCWLVHRGLASCGEAALAMICRLRSRGGDPTYPGRISPETPAQIAMIRNWPAPRR
ncbi:MAG: hypothetical protein ABRQ24_04610 [Syntrophomonadaceae bacterium]